MLDHTIVTETWKDSILNSFPKYKQLLLEYRKQLRKDKWEGLKWLYIKAGGSPDETKF